MHGGTKDDEERQEHIVRIPIDEQKQGVIPPSPNAILEGNLVIPKWSEGIVVFAHGSGSSRNSPRNQYVAEVLNNALPRFLQIFLQKKRKK